jgi:small subunit ribosomal protein S27e
MPKVKRDLLVVLGEKGRKSYYLEIKCSKCDSVSRIFSHCQSINQCQKCKMVLARPTGGKVRLTQGCHYRKSKDK